MIKNQELMYHAGLSKGLLDEALRVLTKSILPPASTPKAISDMHSAEAGVLLVRATTTLVGLCALMGALPAVEQCVDEWRKAN